MVEIVKTTNFKNFNFIDLPNKYMKYVFPDVVDSE